MEFLVDVDRSEFYFIEVNPRIQVEHTVTEMITGIDLVKSQILVADGHLLHEPPLAIPAQDAIERRGVAMQVRITTEDPDQQFMPDYGRITTYRSPGGFAIRLDGGNGFGGAVITPYFDSLLVKLTTWGTTLEEAVSRSDRSLREFRIRGVKTNIAFLLNLLAHPTFASGGATTTFIDDTPELFQSRAPRDRATKILAYLADVIVNGRDDVKQRYDPARVLVTPVPPPTEGLGRPPDGLRQQLLEIGPERLAQRIRDEKRLLITDTTLRDAHQSLLATRVRTLRHAGDRGHDRPPAAQPLQRRDVGGRHVRHVDAVHPGGSLGSPDRAAAAHPEHPVSDAAPRQQCGRLHVVPRQRRPGVHQEERRRRDRRVSHLRLPERHGEHAHADRGGARGHPRACAKRPSAIPATSWIRPARNTRLRYYVRLAKELVGMGTHVLGIKDMAGLCTPYAAYALVKALREEVGVPIHFHTHDTSGINAASVLRAADAGVDIADAAIASMGGMTSQPCLNSLVKALRHTDRDTGLDLPALDESSRYWAAVRELYYPFEEGLKAPESDVYQHEMPGGQYTNFKQQAKSMGLERRWQEVCDAYVAANQLVGDIVKVTPSSKVVGDLALFMVTNGLTAEDIMAARTPLHFPQSVVEMMQGMLGQPEGGWPRAFQEAVLRSAHAQPIEGRPGAALPPADFKAAAEALPVRTGDAKREEDVLSSLLYPRVYADFANHWQQYENTSVIPTVNFFYGLQAGEEASIEIERGKTLIVRYFTTGAAHSDGTRTVFFELNGHAREVNVVDRSVEAVVKRNSKADPGNANHVAAPMPGKVSTVAARKGQPVRAGERLLSIEAMKMETAVYSPRDTVVADVLIAPGATVEARDLLVVLEG